LRLYSEFNAGAVLIYSPPRSYILIARKSDVSLLHPKYRRCAYTRPMRDSKGLR